MQLFKEGWYMKGGSGVYRKYYRAITVIQVQTRKESP
jgi:hypothetical protein